MASKGNDTTKTKQTAEPWKPIQPYLTGAFADAQNVYKQGAPDYYSGQTVAPMSNYTQGSYDALAQRAANGSPIVGQAQDEMSKVLSGQYLSAGNPYLQGAIESATRPITDAFTSSVMPGIDSNFSSAGRYGSGMQQGAYNDANNTLARQIGDVSSQMAYANYGNERSNMMNAMQQAPAFAQNDYKDIAMMGLAGEGYDKYNQSLIDADKARYDYGANKDMSWLQNYVGLLGGSPPPSTTTTNKTPAQSPWATVAGAGVGLLGSALSGGVLGGLGAASAPLNPLMVGTFY